MSRWSAGLGTALFLVIAPGLVVGVIPWWISRWQVQGWHMQDTWFQDTWFAVPLVRGLGFVLIAAGVLIFLETFARFAVEGLGTPAPILPPQHLVIRGSYRYVRNPMYVAGVSAVCGQALVLGDWRLLAYGLVVWLCAHLFVIGYEEPTLRRTFGSEYAAYCARVRRWLPLMKVGQ
jgi:protein-S-isoprenylcysteine O-methyltransferase Ste14